MTRIFANYGLLQQLPLLFGVGEQLTFAADLTRICIVVAQLSHLHFEHWNSAMQRFVR